MSNCIILQNFKTQKMYVYAKHLGHKHKLIGQHSLNTRLPIGPFAIVAHVSPYAHQSTLISYTVRFSP